MGARLARPAFRYHELAAREVRTGPGQDRQLQRQHMLAVEVLVQAFVVASTVLQDQRRGPRLAGAVAAHEEGVQRRGVAQRLAEPLVPPVRDRAGCGYRASRNRATRGGSGSAKSRYAPRPHPWRAITTVLRYSASRGDGAAGGRALRQRQQAWHTAWPSASSAAARSVAGLSRNEVCMFATPGRPAWPCTRLLSPELSRYIAARTRSNTFQKAWACVVAKLMRISVPGLRPAWNSAPGASR